MITTEQFLSAFWPDPATGHFRQFHDSAPREANLPGHNLSGSWQSVRDEASAFSAAGYGTFFLPNQGGPTDADITRYNAAWIDLDHGAPLPTAWHVQPSIVTVRDGNHHVYWLLERDTITDADTFRDVQRRLAQHYGSDKSVINPARVMRLPMTRHLKDPTRPSMYTVSQWNPERRYALADITTTLPALDTDSLAAPSTDWTEGPRGGTPIPDDDALIAKAIAVGERRTAAQVFGSVADRATFRQLWEGDAVALGAIWPEASERGYDSSSAAMALASHLAFWTGGDMPRMERLMYRSGLDKSKWGAQGDPRNRLRRQDIPRSVAGCTSWYTAPIQTADATPDTIDALCAEIDAGVHGVLDMHLAKIGAGFPTYVINREWLRLAVNRSFWIAAQNSVQFLTDEYALHRYNEKEAVRLIEKNLNVGNFFDMPGLTDTLALMSDLYQATTLKKIEERVHTVAPRVFLDYLKAFRQCASYAFRTDIFCTEPRIDTGRTIASAVVPFDLKSESLPASANPAIVIDYKQHFSELDEVLRFFVSAKVARNRKNAYLWIRATSNWGKGLFNRQLERLGLYFGASLDELDSAVKGGASGIRTHDLARALVLGFDELTKINDTFRKLDDSVQISEKYQMSARVPIYTKFITTAEEIPALESEYGVDSQIGNRMSLITKTGRITDRKLHKVSMSEYSDSVCLYIRDTVTRIIEEYRVMGERAAADKAQQFMADFHARYGLANGGRSFDDRKGDLARRVVSFFYENRLTNGGMVETDSDGCMYVSNPTIMFEKFALAYLGHSEKGWIPRHRGEVFKMIDVDGEMRQRRFNGKNRRCLKVRIDDWKDGD